VPPISSWLPFRPFLSFFWQIGCLPLPAPLNLPLFIISDKYSAIRSRTKGHRFQNNFTLGGEGIEKSDFRSGTRKRKVANEMQTLCLLAVSPKKGRFEEVSQNPLEPMCFCCVLSAPDRLVSTEEQSTIFYRMSALSTPKCQQ
jgi:hypothetical protein